jgi:hypothetical protein
MSWFMYISRWDEKMYFFFKNIAGVDWYCCFTRSFCWHLWSLVCRVQAKRPQPRRSSKPRLLICLGSKNSRLLSVSIGCTLVCTYYTKSAICTVNNPVLNIHGRIMFAKAHGMDIGLSPSCINVAPSFDGVCFIS